MNLETNRLILRELNTDDTLDFYMLNEDPEVIKYTGDKPFVDLDEAGNFISGYSQYMLYSVGRLAVIRKEDGAFLGWCGLRYQPDKNEYDIGFRFFRKYWNNGYATEAANACINYGFTARKISSIIGCAVKENEASIKVLEKLGMTYESITDFDVNEGVLYRIANPL